MNGQAGTVYQEPEWEEFTPPILPRALLTMLRSTWSTGSPGF